MVRTSDRSAAPRYKWRDGFTYRRHRDRGPIADRRHASAAQPDAESSQLTYHGGTVLATGNQTHVIYWVPDGSAVSDRYVQLIDRYFADVAATSSDPNTLYGVADEYALTNYDFSPPDAISDGSALRESTFMGSTFDRNAFPTNDCGTQTAPADVCVRAESIDAEVAHLIYTLGLPTTASDVYFVFTPDGVYGTGGGCAWHWWANTTADTRVPYAYIPYRRWGGPCAPHVTSGAPNGNDADAIFTSVSHEHIEAITDPFGAGWQDASGNEIADKCEGRYLAPDGTALQRINGHYYVLQQEWSNLVARAEPGAGGCVSRGDTVPPVFNFLSTAFVSNARVLDTEHIPLLLRYSATDDVGVSRYQVWQDSFRPDYSYHLARYINPSPLYAQSLVLELRTDTVNNFDIYAWDSRLNMAFASTRNLRIDLIHGAAPQVRRVGDTNGRWISVNGFELFSPGDNYGTALSPWPCDTGYAELQFFGRAVAYLGTRTWVGAGSARVSVDNGAATVVSEVGDPSILDSNHVLYTQSWRADGWHTLRIACADGGRINIDEILVLHGEP